MNAFYVFFATMNISSSSSTSCVMKEVHAHLPEETAVAVELRKEKERAEEQKGLREN